MKRASAIAVMLALSIPVSGQQGQPPLFKIGVHIVTDREGVDFTPYVRTVLDALIRNWKNPAGESGTVIAKLQIKPDGTVRPSNPVLEQTAGDESITEAALAAILASTPFKPLPAQFHGPYLELRVSFSYARGPYRELQGEILYIRSIYSDN